jgi:hypothetical protein
VENVTPSSVSKRRLCLLTDSAGFLFLFFFDPGGGRDKILRNVGLLSMDYTVLYLRDRTLKNLLQLPGRAMENKEFAVYLWVI